MASTQSSTQVTQVIKADILSAMEKIDPFLRFLTKATGKTLVPLDLLQSVLPRDAFRGGARGGDAGVIGGDKESAAGANSGNILECAPSVGNEGNIDGDGTANNGNRKFSTFDSSANANNSNNERKDKDIPHYLKEMLLELTYRGVLSYHPNYQIVGFPPPPSSSPNSSETSSPKFEFLPSNADSSKVVATTSFTAPDSYASLSVVSTIAAAASRLPKPPAKLIGKGLHGSSESAAKRRMKVLKWTLERNPCWTCQMDLVPSLPSQPSSPLLASLAGAAFGSSSGLGEEEASSAALSINNGNMVGQTIAKMVGSPKRKSTKTSTKGNESQKKETMASIAFSEMKSDKSVNSGEENKKEKPKKDHLKKVESTIHSTDAKESHINDHECNQRKDAFQALSNLFNRCDSLKNKKDASLFHGFHRNQSKNDTCAETTTESISVKTTEENDFSNDDDKCLWLPCQAAYAGSHPGRDARYGTLSKETLAKIPVDLLKLFDLDTGEMKKDSVKDGSSGNCSGGNCHVDAKQVSKAEDAPVPTKEPRRRLFLHQAQAINAALIGIHTVVCTGTGSGKSLCFLLPVLAKVIMSSMQQQKQFFTSNSEMKKRRSNSGLAALLLFPTKALAQDQFSKLAALLQSLSLSNANNTIIRAGVIDGDTPHSQRDVIASECQIILTNPDTLHAAILPNWKKRPAYQQLLSRITTVVVDEAHVYEGAFGAHVSMVLARLKRVCRVASSPTSFTTQGTIAPRSSADGELRNYYPDSNLLFIACSATMIHPEQHFRLLCPIGEKERVCVLTSEEDGSPRAPKHFFVWNPPILDVHGNSIESVFLPTKSNKMESRRTDEKNKELMINDSMDVSQHTDKSRKRKRKIHSNCFQSHTGEEVAVCLLQHKQTHNLTRRRHAADERAYLLAKAISTHSLRCIAFCKTRSLVEWVYERCLSILQSNPATFYLTSRVESYRGGYTAEVRRSIEERLFRRELWGVVGTNALELGVDVGGIDLTLHCGYPGSINSLLQQSGRGGRGRGGGDDVPSCAIMICFNSPTEQFLWRNPKSLLSRGVAAPPTLPVNGSVIQGHLLCAGDEFPLTGDRPVSCLLNEFGCRDGGSECLPDEELLGPRNVYHDGVEYLVQKGLLTRKVVRTMTETQGSKTCSVRVGDIDVYTTHPVRSCQTLCFYLNIT